MTWVHAIAIALFLAGTLVFCLAPGEVGGSGWRYVGTELIKIEEMSDGWIALGSGLIFAAWIVLMLSCDIDERR